MRIIVASDFFVENKGKVPAISISKLRNEYGKE